MGEQTQQRHQQHSTSQPEVSWQELWQLRAEDVSALVFALT